MARIIIETDEQEYGALAKRKPDPPAAAPLPQNPAWVQTWQDENYRPAIRQPSEKISTCSHLRDEDQSMRNYAALTFFVLAIVIGFNGCVNAIKDDAVDNYRQQLLETKGLLN